MAERKAAAKRGSRPRRAELCTAAQGTASAPFRPCAAARHTHWSALGNAGLKTGVRRQPNLWLRFKPWGGGHGHAQCAAVGVAHMGRATGLGLDGPAARLKLLGVSGSAAVAGVDETAAATVKVSARFDEPPPYPSRSRRALPSRALCPGAPECPAPKVKSTHGRLNFARRRRHSIGEATCASLRLVRRSCATLLSSSPCSTRR